jgi:hypothetical protein
VRRWYKATPEIVLLDVRSLKKWKVLEGASEDPSRLGESMRRQMRGGPVVTHRSARCTQVLLLTDKGSTAV